MQIEKILIIESPIQLAKMIDSRPEILDRSSDDDYLFLRYLCDSVSLFINGCKCNEENNYEAMMDAYSRVKKESIAKNIAACVDCDRVDFK